MERWRLGEYRAQRLEPKGDGFIHAAEQQLRAWYATASRARWKRPFDVKDDYRNAGFIANNGVVFNIKGNAYRLLVAMRYDKGVGFVRFIGTHAAYDRIAARTI
ncbi:MAG: type II toxin-antitoxin system HigB family toxin [Gammaproteobacteria bacterium]